MTYKQVSGEKAPTTNTSPTQGPALVGSTLVLVDIMVLVVYFLLVLAVGFWVRQPAPAIIEMSKISHLTKCIACAQICLCPFFY